MRKIVKCPYCKNDIDVILLTEIGAIVEQEITLDEQGDMQWSYPDVIDRREKRYRCPECLGIFCLEDGESIDDFIGRNQ